VLSDLSGAADKVDGGAAMCLVGFAVMTQVAIPVVQTHSAVIGHGTRVDVADVIGTGI